MLDINFIRENADLVKKGLKKRLFTNVSLVDDAIKIDEQKRKLMVEVESLRAKRNKLTKDDIDEGKRIKLELSKIEPDLKEKEDKLQGTLMDIPNLPNDDIPEGAEENKKVVKTFGKPPKFDFEPKDHLEIGVQLGIIDMERAAKISGSRFAYLKGDGALLELALVNFAMEKLTKEGFTPVFPPMLIKKEITDKLGYWHGGGNENYYLVSDYQGLLSGGETPNPLYLVGTGEHSTVPMYKDETFDIKELPKKYVAFSSCFRREAGTYGKDTRGILRVHQFDKVEMVVFLTPEESEKVLQQMLKISENLMEELGLSYQVVTLAAGDIGFPTAKTYDIETWMPGQNKYRETHSISTTTDYQARRLNIKYRYEGSALMGDVLVGEAPLGAGPIKTSYVHILNGTAFAIGRTIIAILENFQQKDGSVFIPKVLQKWMGKEYIK